MYQIAADFEVLGVTIVFAASTGPLHLGCCRTIYESHRIGAVSRQQKQDDTAMECRG